MSNAPVPPGPAPRYFSCAEAEGGFIVTQASGEYGSETNPRKERTKVASTLAAVGKLLREHFAEEPSDG